MYRNACWCVSWNLAAESDAKGEFQTLPLPKEQPLTETVCGVGRTAPGKQGSSKEKSRGFSVLVLRFSCLHIIFNMTAQSVRELPATQLPREGCQGANQAGRILQSCPSIPAAPFGEGEWASIRVKVCPVKLPEQKAPGANPQNHSCVLTKTYSLLRKLFHLECVNVDTQIIGIAFANSYQVR